MNKQTITINGVRYDAHTGMRLDTAPVATPSPKQAVASKSIHAKAQRSNTLARKHVIKGQPTSLKTPFIDGVRRSSSITKFAPRSTPQQPVKSKDDNIVISHPVQHAVRQKATPPQPSAATQPSSKDIKTEAIAKAMHNSVHSTPPAKKSFLQKHTRGLSVASASLAVIMVAGYITYANLPNLSVRIASANAGVDATYPTYQPSGYSLNGPVAFDSGEVSMKFTANAGPQEFTVEQSKTNWDSSALLENLVKAQAKDDYSTYTDSGLTIYVYGTNAAWVNGGVLHTIEGDAPLTNDQIRRIATSM